MLKFNLQFFGGNGASAPDGGTPEGGNSGGGAPETVLGPKVYATTAEALGKKGRPMNPEKATLGANPNYHPAYSAYSENCQRCVVAYEARRRGYDVVAQPTYAGDTMPYANNYANNFVGAKIESVGARNAAGVLKNVQNKMAGYGDGSRGIISVQWKGSRSGHVFNVEQKGGKTIFRDAQTGHSYKPENVFKKVSPKSVEIVRVDNLAFSEQAAKAVTKDK